VNVEKLWVELKKLWRGFSPRAPYFYVYVLIYLSRNLDQETVKGPFGFRVKLSPVTYYQFNHSKVEAIPLSALLKDTSSELAGLSPH